MKIRTILTLCIFTAMLLQACSPIPKLLRPKLEITVLDQQNQKMDNVDVVLNISYLDGTWVKYQEVKKTENGTVIFPKVGRIGVTNRAHQSYFWSICIFKEGYERLNFDPPKNLKKRQELSFVLESSNDRIDLNECINKKKSPNRVVRHE